MTNSVFHLPQQARSQKTLRNIMTATTELLDQKAFNEISVQEIVERAGCSVGGFYGRFKDKDSLLHALDDQLTQDVIELIQTLTREDTDKYTNLPDFVTAILRTLYDLHKEKRGLLRTLLIAGRTETDIRFVQREERINAMLTPIFMKLLSFREQINHPNPEMAIQFGLIQNHFALREVVLWNHPPGSIPVKGDELISELARGYLNYLEYQKEPI